MSCVVLHVRALQVHIVVALHLKWQLSNDPKKGGISCLVLIGIFLKVILLVFAWAL